MNYQRTNTPLHGKTLEYIVNSLVECFAWNELGDRINMHCFKNKTPIENAFEIVVVRSNKLTWVLLIISWPGFAAYIFLIL